MSKADLKREIRALYRDADGGLDLPGQRGAHAVHQARHPDALAGISGRYAVLAADTGYARAFALEDGIFSSLAPGAPVDVAVSGCEKDLLAVFRRELAPLAALLRGKIRVRGDRAALMRFAEFL